MCSTKIPGQRPFAEEHNAIAGITCPGEKVPSWLFNIQHQYVSYKRYHQPLRTLIRCIYSKIHHQVTLAKAFSIASAYYMSCSSYGSRRTFLNASDVKARSFRRLIGGVMSYSAGIYSNVRAPTQIDSYGSICALGTVPKGDPSFFNRSEVEIYVNRNLSKISWNVNIHYC